MRYDSEHKARTRERILHAAAAAIRTNGINGVALADIMASADLTNGGFYAHFKSKDDLIAHAVTFMFDERYARMLAKIDTAGAEDPRDVLAVFIDRYLSMRHCEAPDIGCPIPALAADVPHMSKDARKRFSAGVSRLVDGLAVLLDRAGMAGARTQAKSTVAELVGALSLARTAESPSVAKSALAASRSALKQRLGLSS
jgi:TetR/AcrR family transcriptional regulator, transcriptional repressor for nem operon